MRNTILITLLALLSALLAVPSFSAVVRVGDNYTEPEKPRHPYLKNTEIYYMTDEGERKEAEFDLYVLKKPIKEQKVCIEAKTGYARWNESLCENKRSDYKWVAWYPKYHTSVELPKARLSISKILARVDNCTVLPFMFKDAVQPQAYGRDKLTGSLIRPHIYGRYDELKTTAIASLHKDLFTLAQLYSIAKVNKCGDYSDLIVSKSARTRYANMERIPPIDHLTE